MRVIRTIRDRAGEPYAEPDAKNTARVLATEQARLSSVHRRGGRAIGPYGPRDSMAGDPASDGGTKVTCDELAADVLAKIAAAGFIAVREQDGNPSLTDINALIVSDGTLTAGPGPNEATIQTGGGGGGTLRVRELDGNPDVQPVDDIRVPNGSIVGVAGSQVTLLFAEFAGSFEVADPGPGTGDIPAGQWGWWYDTTNNRQYLVRNRGGSLFYVELTC